MGVYSFPTHSLDIDTYRCPEYVFLTWIGGACILSYLNLDFGFEFVCIVWDTSVVHSFIM